MAKKTRITRLGEKGFSKKTQKVRELATKRGFNPDLFVIPDDPSDIALKSLDYLTKKGDEDKYQPLFFVDPDGQTVELAESGSFVNNLSYEEHRLYVPEELLIDVKDAWN